MTRIPVAIDPEETPPPQEPPKLEDLVGDLPPEFRAPFMALGNAVRELDVGLTRVWDARNVPEQIKQLTTAVGVLVQRTAHVEEFTRAVNQQAGQLHRIAVWMEERNKDSEKDARDVEALSARVTAIETSAAGFTATIGAAVQRIEKAVEGVVRRVEENAADAKALEVRVRSLEDSRTKAKGAWWVLGPLLAAVGAIASVIAQKLFK